MKRGGVAVRECAPLQKGTNAFYYSWIFSIGEPVFVACGERQVLSNDLKTRDHDFGFCAERRRMDERKVCNIEKIIGKEAR